MFVSGVIGWCVIAFVLWLAINAATNFMAVKFEFLEPCAPNDAGGTSRVRLRIGPRSIRANHVMLSEKSLSIASGFLVGLWPVDIAEVRVDRYRVALSWGLVRFIRAVLSGGERERVAPKLTLHLEGVHIKVQCTGPEAWLKQKEAVETGIESTNHTTANALTALIDKTAPGEDVPPSAINRFIDGVVNGLDVEVKNFHISVASADHDPSCAAGSIATLPQQHQQQQQHHVSSSISRQVLIGGDSGKPVGVLGATGGAVGAVTKGWILGIQFSKFRLFASGPPTDQMLGATPRTMQVGGFDLYYDADGTSVRPGGSSNTRDASCRDGGSEPGVRRGGAAAVQGSINSHGGDPEHDRPWSSPTDNIVPVVGTGHNSMLKVKGITGTFLLPDLMCVLCGKGRQPGGKGKLLGVRFEEIQGVVIQLEPFQVFGLLNRVLPILAMTGPYMEWCMATRLQWHQKAFACSGGGGGCGEGEGGTSVPESAEELAQYGNALGSLPGSDGENAAKKGNATRLMELDKGMSLSQIMLTRMRVRKWEVCRPEHVMNTAKMLLDSFDPFQGISVDQLAQGLPRSGGKVGGGEGGEQEEAEQPGGGGSEEQQEGDDKCEPDEESPSVSSGHSEINLRETLALRTNSHEEELRLEALLYYVAQVHGAADVSAFGWGGLAMLVNMFIMLSAFCF